MNRKCYFDKPYSLGDYKTLVIPLVIVDGSKKEVIPLGFPCEVTCDYPGIYVYYDDYLNEFHIVIPNPVCPRWPMLICEVNK